MFLAYDGDKIGKKLESLLIENNENQIKKYTIDVSIALKQLENELLKNGCEIIFASGDSILAKTSVDFQPEQISRRYDDITFSLGIGKTPLEAMLALKKAKSNGNGSYCKFSLERKYEKNC